MILSISLIGFLWVWSKPKFKWTSIKIASLIFVSLLFLTSVLGIDLKSSFLGVDPYFQGWVVYAYLFLFSIIVSSLQIKLDYLAVALTVSSLIVSLVAIQGWILKNLLGFEIPNYAGRVVSTFGQPNFYSGFLLLTSPFFYFLLLKKKGWWIMIGSLLSILAIILSQSRSAYLILSILMILGLMKELVKTRWLIFTLILTTIILIMSSSIFFSNRILWEEIIEPHLTKNPDLTKAGVENRVYIWPVAWQIFLQKPVTGYGLENIDRVFATYFETNKHALFEANANIQPVLISLKELVIDRTHNYCLDLLLFSGIFGLLAWVILVFLLIKKLIYSKITAENTTLLVGLLTYLIWIQFQNQSIVQLIYFWLLVGLVDQVSNE